MKKIYLLLFVVSSILSCQSDKKTTSTTEDFKVDFEKFKLDNGLTVILHEDHSDPVVAVALTAHVGSARELQGRTGFAHLFEHLLFLESENLGKGGLDKMSARVGGSGANGSTNRDRTNYFQTVPKDALEKMIWAEADKLGYFINTVTDPVLAKEKQVVKNEKRQSYDNRPYGHQNYVIAKNLYPADHPYNWQVIGSLEDLQNAKLQDVKDFYNHWYVPNNVTLTISGDFDPGQTKTWVKKYFDEIPRGEDITPLQQRIPQLDSIKNLYYEDNFASLPRLTMTWAAPVEYQDDSYALGVLTDYLANGKTAPLYKTLVEEKQLTTDPGMYYNGSELAGEVSVVIRGNDGVDLDSIQSGIEKAFSAFEAEGIPEKDLKRMKAKQESRFYNGLSSALGTGFQLAQYQIFTDDPGFINKDIKNIQAVTAADIKRVFHKYIKGKNYVATSFVPKEKPQLALENAKPADVIEEKIVEGAEETFDPSIAADYERTPSSFDRSIEPTYGESPDLKVPEVWQDSLDNGITLYGIKNTEVPLVYFFMELQGGQLLDNLDKPGVANLVAEMLSKGTATKTTAQLQAAIDLLGASINVDARQESIAIYGSTLARNYEETMQLVKEILLEPRWDAQEFDLAKKEVLTRLQQEKSDPGSIAENAFAKAIYGKDHILSRNILGNPESVSTIKLQDLKNYYDRNFTPSLASVEIVGAVSQDKAVQQITKITKNWPSKKVTIPTYKSPEIPQKPVIYFINVPGAKQSQLRFGYIALAGDAPDYYPATLMNYRLGGGGFASELTQSLREGKGYTYGIRSRFEGDRLPGAFVISSGVRSNVTFESTKLVRDILAKYPDTFNEDDLELTQNYFLKSGARDLETPYAKINYLNDLAKYGFSPDYAKKRQQIAKNITLKEIKEMASTYADPSKLIYVIVGDAQTQLKRLKNLGIENINLVDEDLKPVQ
ncbi:MAG TPA: insulinase family protein [Leeuwenhoekiella sp.]|nr:insulinase family protein [Leeuwenhoekiella sp.]